MALAFNIPNAGPLAQISVGIGDLATATQLAMGAYGWWKGRETAQSLTDSLEACGASLATTSSFNSRQYQQLRREKGGMLGVIVQNGTICQTPLPNASTATPTDPGVACLRALTTGILCMYSTHATVEILKDLIPKYLCRKDLDDLDITFDGPLSLPLKQWVQSVAVEEDSDIIRDELLLHVQSEEHDLTGIPCRVLGGLGMEQQSELEHVMGVLRWVLTPWASRTSNDYPTRSLRARSMASLMDRLGFQVHAAPVICHAAEDYTDFVRKNQHLPGKVEVVLVTSVDIPTDYLSTHDLSNHLAKKCLDHLSIKSPVIPVREIPWTIFNMFRCEPFNCSSEDIAHFVDVWDFSFRNARALFHRFRVDHNDGNDIRILLHKVSGRVLSQREVSLLNLFGHELKPGGFRTLCAAPFRKYAPSIMTDPTWAVDKLRPWVEGNPHTVEPGIERPVLMNYCSLKAIILGSIYGLCSNAFINTHAPNQGMDAALSISASIVPELVCNGEHDFIRKWCSAIDESVTSDHERGVATNEWHSTLCQLFVGTKRYPVGTLLGLKDHGLFLISDFVVRPCLRSDSSQYWHLLRGQPLTIPTKESGAVLASETPPPSPQFTFEGLATTNDLEPSDTFSSGDDFRVDLEPHWEADPRYLILQVRYRGAPVSRVDIRYLLRRVSTSRARCKCEAATQKVALPENATFQRLGVQDLMDNVPYNLKIEPPNNVLVDAGTSEGASILAIGTSLAMDFAIASDGMRCALSKLTSRYIHGTRFGLGDKYQQALSGVALIIPCSSMDMNERAIVHPQDPVVHSFLQSEVQQPPQTAPPQQNAIPPSNLIASLRIHGEK